MHTQIRTLARAATAQPPHDHCKPPRNHNATTSAALQPRPTSKKQKRRPRRPPPIIISVLIRRAYSSASPIFPTTTATAAQAATATTAMAANFANAFILLPPCSFDFLYRGCTGTHRTTRDPPDCPGSASLISHFRHIIHKSRRTDCCHLFCGLTAVSWLDCTTCARRCQQTDVSKLMPANICGLLYLITRDFPAVISLLQSHLRVLRHFAGESLSFIVAADVVYDIHHRV